MLVDVLAQLMPAQQAAHRKAVRKIVAAGHSTVYGLANGMISDLTMQRPQGRASFVAKGIAGLSAAIWSAAMIGVCEIRD